MKIDLDLDLAGLSPEDWRQQVDDIGEEHGYYQSVGRDHAALFIDAGSNLLVTFENRAAAMSAPFGRPRGFDMVTREGWSLLNILADGETWFRGPEVFGYFDRLVDEGFLEDFDNVLFFGAHDAGYAAAAYSVTAPGARALLLRPVATLDPAMTGWDKRFAEHRRLDFTSRYGYAPDMIEALEEAYVIYDPTQAPEAMHAALYRRPNVTYLPARRAKPRVETMLDGMRLTAPLMKAAMAGTLDELSFARAWRGRRDAPGYVRNLLKRTIVDDRPGLAARVCAYGMRTADAEFYEARLDDIVEASDAAIA